MSVLNQPELRQADDPKRGVVWRCPEHDRELRIFGNAAADWPTSVRYCCAGACYWVRMDVGSWQHDTGDWDCTYPSTFVPFNQLSLFGIEREEAVR